MATMFPVGVPLRQPLEAAALRRLRKPEVTMTFAPPRRLASIFAMICGSVAAAWVSRIRVRARRIFGIEFDRHAEVADIIVQEVLAAGVRRPIAGDPCGFTEAIERGIGNVQRSVCGGRPAGIRMRRGDAFQSKAVCIFAQGRSPAVADVARHGRPFEEHDLRRFGEFGVPKLLCVPVYAANAVGVDPASAIPPSGRTLSK